MGLIVGILIPFLGTTLGSACVFLLKTQMKQVTQKIFTGFAAGVMIAASIWSLLIPALEQSESMGNLSFLPASIGLSLGVAFLLILDNIIPHLHPNTNAEEGPRSNLTDTAKLMLAVTLHNIPEGIRIIVSKSKHNKKGIPIPCTLPEHVLSNFILLRSGEIIKVL